MIRDHDFNCRWWGGRVGIVEDPAFFSIPDSDRRNLLVPYAWVEFRSPAGNAPEPWILSRAGFAQVDTQLRFRIGLQRIAPLPASREPVLLRFASDEAFALPRGDWPDFPHERFRHLPGASPTKITERYALWATTLLAESPDWCVEVSREGEPLGWFFAEQDGEHLHLALAMLRRGSTLSGLELYTVALQAFARRGARRGEARFSVENRAVLNIYARLGAAFVETIGCWMWCAR